MNIPKESKRKAKILRAIASPVRLCALEMLLKEERGVRELRTKIGISHKHFGYHARELKRHKIISGRRDGRNMIYKIRKSWKFRLALIMDL